MYGHFPNSLPRKIDKKKGKAKLFSLGCESHEILIYMFSLILSMRDQLKVNFSLLFGPGRFYHIARNVLILTFYFHLFVTCGALISQGHIHNPVGHF